jgi:hypothetical protein
LYIVVVLSCSRYNTVITIIIAQRQYAEIQLMYWTREPGRMQGIFAANAHSQALYLYLDVIAAALAPAADGEWAARARKVLR